MSEPPRFMDRAETRAYNEELAGAGMARSFVFLRWEGVPPPPPGSGVEARKETARRAARREIGRSRAEKSDAGSGS